MEKLKNKHKKTQKKTKKTALELLQGAAPWGSDIP
jgi:hypothetical protein